MIPPPPEKLPAAKFVVHTIDTQDSPPIRQKNYRMPPKVHEALLAEAEKLIENEIIEPSSSEWRSPIVMARKSNGGYRMCIDFKS